MINLWYYEHWTDKQKYFYVKKILKYTCTVKFDNKALEPVKLPQVFILPEIVFQLIDILKNDDNHSTVT